MSAYSYKDRKYEIVPYNPDWVTQFEEYKSKIRNIFKDASIEHIGSTAVPGLGGKGIIDIMVGFKSKVRPRDRVRE